MAQHANPLTNRNNYPAAQTCDILLHGIPADAIRASFARPFRVLKPGSEPQTSAIGRYAHLNTLQEWQADQIARISDEPFLHESASLDPMARVTNAPAVELDRNPS